MKEAEMRARWEKSEASGEEPQLVLCDEEGEDVCIEVRHDVVRIRQGGATDTFHYYDLKLNREEGEPLGAFGDRVMAEILAEMRRERRGN